MKRFTSLIFAAALSVAGTSRAATSAGPGRAFVFPINLGRTLQLGETPQNAILQKGSSYRVRIETRSDDTARATFYDVTGRRVGHASGVVEHRTSDEHADIPSASIRSCPVRCRAWTGRCGSPSAVRNRGRS